MSDRHTPGPWEWEAGKLRCNDGWILYADDSWMNTNSAVRIIEANKAVIAAAPDLLAACEALVKRANILASSGALIRHLDAFALTDPIKQARVAIAKAKGGNNG